MKLLSIFLLTLALSGTANAKMYMCTDVDGGTSFKDQPCAESEQMQWSKEEKNEQQRQEEALLKLVQKQQQKQQMIDAAIEAATWRPTGDYTAIKIQIENQLVNNSLFNQNNVTIEEVKAGASPGERLKFEILNWVQALKNDEGFKIRLVYQATDATGLTRTHNNVIRTDLEGQITSNKAYVGKRSFEWE